MATAQEAPTTDTVAAPAATATVPAAVASSSSASAIQANTTVLSTLHNLLRAHVAAHPSPTLPHLHPYAPLPASAWKGKAKAELLSQAQQADALQAIRETMEGAKAVLAKRESDRLRLTRAMKEVVNHETALLPLGTTLSSLPPARRIPLSPKGTSDLLHALAKRLGLQCFAEDAGNQKTTLTLAGERFVVDVDIETDSDGKVTIHKLTATHITPGGETGKSEWIERVMRKAIDSHTSLWNSRQGNDDKLRASGRAVECLLGELKMLDDLAVRDKTGIDYFAELETLTAAVEEKVKGADEKVRIYPDPNQGIFPSFRLFDSGVNSNPTLRLRPTLQGESVSLPPAPEAQQAATDGAAAGGNAMEVDQQHSIGICKGSWVIESVDEYPEPCSSGKGIVVRRTWAIPGPEDGESKAWSASVKAEGMVYQGAVEAMGMAALPIFPYNTDFVHPTSGLKQHWSMGHPGPEGFVVGRVAVPGTWEAVGSVCSALRVQAVLNELISSAFPPSKLKSQAEQQPDDASGGAEGDDAEMVDISELEGTRSDVPISAMLFQQSMRVSMPLSEDAEGALLLEIQATPAPPYVSVSWRVDDGVTVDDATRGRLDAAVAGTKGMGPADLIGIVRDVANALTPARETLDK